MLQQSANPLSKSTNWLDFCSYWIYTKRTLEEKLEQGDLDIINVVSTVQVTYSGSIVSIAWDGTSKSVYRGKLQRTIAGKLTTTDMLEVQLKRENIVGLPKDLQTWWQQESNGILTIRTIGVSASALIPSEVLEKALTVICVLVGDNFSLFLELRSHQSE